MYLFRKDLESASQTSCNNFNLKTTFGQSGGELHIQHTSFWTQLPFSQLLEITFFQGNLDGAEVN